MLIEQMDSYQVDLMALQELRWTGQNILEKKKHTLFYSCHQDKHAFGTGFLLSKRIKDLVIDFKANSPRLCKIRIRGLFSNLSIISAHAPTEEKNDDVKDAFYDDLETLLNSCPRHDIKIILGDLNAKIGKEAEFQSISGKHSLHHESNENGLRVISFAAAHDMVVASTRFPHKDIHKHTWRTPDGKTYNQIDHVLVNSRHISSVLDVRSMRGANIDSDHYLVVIKVRCRISNTKKIKCDTVEKLNCNRLKDPIILNLYQTELSNNLEIADLQDEVNKKWESLKNILKSTGKTILGIKPKRTSDDWFDSECKEIT